MFGYKRVQLFFFMVKKMKDIYFEPQVKEASFKTKLVNLLTHWLTVFWPSGSVKLSKKVLGNPYSRRHYEMRTQVKPITQFLKTQFGSVCLHEFKTEQTDTNKNILLCHGWGDSSTRFTQLIDKLIQDGYRVWSMDQIGHGQSEGSYADLYRFVEGVKSVVDFLEENGAKSAALVGHSKGALTLLNLPKSLLANRKVILISAPAHFFDNMFDAVASVGVAKLMLTNFLHRAAQEYKQDWQSLATEKNIYKADDNFLFIHDEDDKTCPYSELAVMLAPVSANVYTTVNFGHIKLLKHVPLLEKVSAFANEPVVALYEADKSY
jgi:pimeloyl-ACP methyl ester carboxylesterase